MRRLFKDFWRKQPKYITVNPETTEKKADQMWLKCPKCGELLYVRELVKTLKVCRKCGYHFRLKALERIAVTLDEDSFEEIDGSLQAVDPLLFPGYSEKLDLARKASGLSEAMITGTGTIENYPVMLGILDSHFIMGSMGCVVGEKIARLADHAISRRIPLLIFSASGGARMQEGVFSLAQMAKTCASIARLQKERLLYISVLTDPTTGGVAASFAALGDVVIAEPGALVGFAGRRVTEQTLREKLPSHFQTAEFCFEHGFIDLVVPRQELKEKLALILSLHSKGGGSNG